MGNWEQEEKNAQLKSNPNVQFRHVLAVENSEFHQIAHSMKRMNYSKLLACRIHT